MVDEKPKRSWLQRTFTMSEEEKAQSRANAAPYVAQARAAEQRRLQGEEVALEQASSGWSLPALLRTYESNDRGEALFAQEAAIFARHGYEPAATSAEGSHLHAGRLLLTGGLSIFAGRKGIRSKGKLTVTFQKRQLAATADGPDVSDQIRKLGELRDAGILTDAEFEGKKADLLSRM